MNAEQITAVHHARIAFVYVRQSTMHQVLHHRDSQLRQCSLADRAAQLGWPVDRIVVLDEDLGQSAAGSSVRSGFERLLSEAASGRAGIILASVASRLARSNRLWYLLLDICSVTETLIADSEGLYDPKAYNDRLLLGLKGTISEAELHSMKQQMVEVIRDKAKRGEFRLPLPAGYIWDELGHLVKTPDEREQAVIALIFERFERLGTIHQVHVSLSEDDIEVPCATGRNGRIKWRRAQYQYLRRTLRHPIYAGTYTFGRRQSKEHLDPSHQVVKRMTPVPREQWHGCIEDHHEGYISKETWERNQERISANKRGPDNPGAPREGSALLQGLVMCGHCGRLMRVQYTRDRRPSRYDCTAARRQQGTPICQSFGAIRIERAVERLVLQAIEPLGLAAMLEAATRYQEVSEAERRQCQREVERARYEVDLTRRKYDEIDPANRLVAREYERRLESALERQEAVEKATAHRLQHLERPLTDAEKERLRRYAADIPQLWRAPTTRHQDRKRIVRALVSQVVVTESERGSELRVDVHWSGGEITTTAVPKGSRRDRQDITTTEVVELVRSLAKEFDDAQIARILIRKNIQTARGHAFTRNRVGCLRFRFGIDHVPALPNEGENVYTAEEAGRLLGVHHSCVIRWVEAGLLRGAQSTKGAPWRVQVTEEDRRRVTAAEAPDGWLSLQAAAIALGVSQQTVLQRLQEGKLEGQRVQTGRRTSWRIRVQDTIPTTQTQLFT